MKLAKKRFTVFKMVMRVLYFVAIVSVLLVLGAALTVISPGYWAFLVPLFASAGFIIYGHLDWYTKAENDYEEALEEYNDRMTGP